MTGLVCNFAQCLRIAVKILSNCPKLRLMTLWICGAITLVFCPATISAQEWVWPDNEAYVQAPRYETKSGDIYVIYGQINRGFLSFDDGAVKENYALVDNSKSVSRAGATYTTKFGSGWTAEGRFEFALRKRETNRVSILDPDDSQYSFDKSELRKLEVSFGHENFGRVFVGQGAMATDGITGEDFSLTTVVAGAAVQDVAGGQFLRLSDGSLSNVKIRQAFKTMGSSRRLRIGYISNTNAGFIFAIAAGQEVLSDFDDRVYADASIRYRGDHGDFRTRFGVGYRVLENNPDAVIGSGSVLHKPTGLNLTVAAGSEIGGEGSYGYTKLGYLKKFFDIGPTAFSLDVYDGNNIHASGGSSGSYGFAVVQKFSKQKFELYATVRRYTYSEPSASYLDSKAILAGFRLTF